MLDLIPTVVTMIGIFFVVLFISGTALVLSAMAMRTFGIVEVPPHG